MHLKFIWIEYHFVKIDTYTNWHTIWPTQNHMSNQIFGHHLNFQYNDSNRDLTEPVQFIQWTIHVNDEAFQSFLYNSQMRALPLQHDVLYTRHEPSKCGIHLVQFENPISVALHVFTCSLALGPIWWGQHLYIWIWISFSTFCLSEYIDCHVPYAMWMWNVCSVDTPYDHTHISIQHTTKTLQTHSHAAS